MAESVVKKRTRRPEGRRDPKCPAFRKPGIFPSRGEGLGRDEYDGESHSGNDMGGVPADFKGKGPAGTI